jgi:hypothetical protein
MPRDWIRNIARALDRLRSKRTPSPTGFIHMQESWTLSGATGGSCSPLTSGKRCLGASSD